MNRRDADYTIAPELRFPNGAFTVETDAEKVLCGLCHVAFRYPYEKARHLTAVHHAYVSRHVDEGGLDLYEWRLP